MTKHPSINADVGELLHHACAELSRRLHAGESCQVETLLQDFPSLASDPRLALDLILTEFRVRQQLGQIPDPQELLRRFPQWNQQLQQRLGSLDVLTANEDSDRTPLQESRADSSETPALLLPELGPHQVGEEIGHGGMGVVYRARDLILDRTVALKVLRSGLFASNDEVARFYREARASARLHHPHIVPIHGMGLYRGQHCYTMPLFSGGTLTRQLPRLGEDLRAGVALMEKVARAVQAAHEQGIIHRDLKPGNILLDEQGEPHVSDFGLAKLLDAPADATTSGQVLGTPAYMAPEQAAGQAGKATAATDVWALGVILYEMLVGRRPFQGKTDSETAWKVLHADPTRPRSLRPGLSRDLQTILLKCLEKDAKRRYASAGAVADELARWLQGQPIQAHPESWLRWTVRKGIRYRTLLAAAVIPVVLLSMALLFLRPRTPEDELKALQNQLAAGHPVDLIGPKSVPRWWRPCVGIGSLDTVMGEPGAFMLDTWHFDLVELLPDPRRERYVFSAEVRQDETHSGDAGIFILHSTQHPSAGVEHSFGALFFADRGAHAGQVSFSLRRLREDLIMNYKSLRVGASFDAKPTAWRKLKVKVAPDGVTAFWEGRELGRMDRSRMKNYAQNLLEQDPVAGASPPALPVRGSLGVFAFQSSVSYRNVRVEPLP
jgi:hypothetical protein